MAHLEVEPKPKRSAWIWILVAIIVIAVAAFLFRKYDAEQADAQRANQSDSITTTNTTASPNWNSVDFYSGETTDEGITDSTIHIRSSGDYTIYTLDEQILFPSERTTLSKNGEDQLKMIGSVLSNKFKGATIGVFGNADSTGPSEENRELGKERAEAVKKWLSEKGEIPAENISVRSLGETKPVASNETKEGRKKNRNVSIVVFPKR